jgi:general secretion pathway protein J
MTMRTRAQQVVAPVGRSAERGFTLVEVMVALLIFGMLAAAGVAILSFSVRAQAATGTALDDTAALERTGAIMAADLAQAVARPARDEAGTLRPALVGDAAGMTLVRSGWTNIDGAARPSLQKLGYRLGERRWQRIAYPQVDGAQPLDPATLIDQVDTVRLRYRFRGGWGERWDGSGGVPLPDAVELRMVRGGRTTYRQLFLVGTGYVPMTLAGNAPV